jgi:hypothetical protein
MNNHTLMVVIPTLGTRLSQLEQALTSLAELHERIPTTIVVVLPKAQSEASLLAAQYGALVVPDPGKGMAEAVNHGLSQRTGEKYYLWLGDDDRVAPEGVQALVSALEQNPGAVVAYGHCEYIDQNNVVGVTNKAGRWARFFLPWGPNFIPHPGTVMSLDALEAVGGYDPRLSYALDLDVFLKLRRHGRFLSLPVVASQFRWHADSLTVADRKASGAEAMVVKRRHLPRLLRPVSGLWNWPVAWAAQVAAHLVGHRMKRLAGQQ